MRATLPSAQNGGREPPLRKTRPGPFLSAPAQRSLYLARSHLLPRSRPPSRSLSSLPRSPRGIKTRQATARGCQCPEALALYFRVFIIILSNLILLLSYSVFFLILFYFNIFFLVCLISVPFHYFFIPTFYYCR